MVDTQNFEGFGICITNVVPKKEHLLLRRIRGIIATQATICWKA